MAFIFDTPATFTVFRQYVRGVKFYRFGTSNWILTNGTNPFVIRLTSGSNWQEVRYTYSQEFIEDESKGWPLHEVVKSCESRLSSSPTVWTDISGVTTITYHREQHCNWIQMRVSGGTTYWKRTIPLPQPTYWYQPIACEDTNP